MVEHLLAKEGVASSNLVSRSTRELGRTVPIQNLGKSQDSKGLVVRPSVSRLHPRTSNYLISDWHNVRPEDDLLLREWLLVLRGDGRKP